MKEADAHLSGMCVCVGARQRPLFEAHAIIYVATWLPTICLKGNLFEHLCICAI